MMAMVLVLVILMIVVMVVAMVKVGWGVSSSPSSSSSYFCQQPNVLLDTSDAPHLLVKYTLLAATVCLAFFLRTVSVRPMIGQVDESELYLYTVGKVWTVGSAGSLTNIVSWVLEQAAGITWVPPTTLCTYAAPFLACITCLATYQLGRSTRDVGTGVSAALLLAIVPGFVSFSTAGRPADGAVGCWMNSTLGASLSRRGRTDVGAVLCMVWMILALLRALAKGSYVWGAVASCLSYGALLLNPPFSTVSFFVALFALLLLILGEPSAHGRLHAAYTGFFVAKAVLIASIPGHGLPLLRSIEQVVALGVFLLLQFKMSLKVSVVTQKYARKLFKSSLPSLLFVGAAIIFLLWFTGYARFASRPLSTASATWKSFFRDLHLVVFLLPGGLYACLKRATEASLYLILHGFASLFLASVWHRDITLLFPVACVLGAVSLSFLARAYTNPWTVSADKPTRRAINELKSTCVIVLVFLFIIFLYFSVMASSNPLHRHTLNLVFPARDTTTGGIAFVDDVREAYAWLRCNGDLKTTATWTGLNPRAHNGRLPFNYWTGGRERRALLAQAFLSHEEDSARLFRSMGVRFVLVRSGARTGDVEDDVGCVRELLAASRSLVAEDYLEDDGSLHVNRGKAAWLDSTLFQLSYQGFEREYTGPGVEKGFDQAREEVVVAVDQELKHFREVFTTEHGLIRVYEVLDAHEAMGTQRLLA